MTRILRTGPDLLLSGSRSLRRAALLSIHDFKIFDGPAERSLHPQGAHPALSGSSVKSGFVPLNGPAFALSKPSAMSSPLHGVLS